MTTLLTGGTGFVGQELIKRLDEVVITSRSQQRASERFGDSVSGVIGWNPARESLVLPVETNFSQVINLMGESIAEGRWNEAKKARIRNSRVEGTRNLVDAILKQDSLPEVMVSASAIGIYGDAGESIVDEEHDHGSGFLTEVCQEWESEAMRLAEHGVRVVTIRIGIVIGENGGAMKKLLPLFRWGLGGNLGNGKQWVGWIHVDDLVGMILWCLENQGVAGPVNGTAPNPVRNHELTKVIASAVHRPAILPAPKFALRLALGEFANSLFFSQRVVPNVALASGFQFQFPTMQKAMEEVVE